MGVVCGELIFLDIYFGGIWFLKAIYNHKSDYNYFEKKSLILFYCLYKKAIFKAIIEEYKGTIRINLWDSKKKWIYQRTYY